MYSYLICHYVAIANTTRKTKRDITTTNHQISALAYELYGLTEEEIRIVDGHKCHTCTVSAQVPTVRSMEKQRIMKIDRTEP